ncbi:hypothetical protein DFH08DRAFT_1011909 [Mycena albidolilacea]|uniref:Uncharacterized protein n=1 Tax=Mycena albidolilacea TaxID=1033008 RepID=A0AAD7EMY5_9AGAR|nr:hypothetical protein DFH08DRAFT_1011909 [Mycena albidolilacea]
MYNATYVEMEDRLQKSNCGCVDAVNTCFAEKNDDAELFLSFSTTSINTGCSEAGKLASDPRWTTRDHERAPRVVQRTHGCRREVRVQRLLRGVEVLPHTSSSIESPVGATVVTVGVFVGSGAAHTNRGGDRKSSCAVRWICGVVNALGGRAATRWGCLGVVGVVAGVAPTPC